MTAVRQALNNHLEANSRAGPWLQQLGDGELARWTKEVRSLLAVSDQLLDAFEHLNLENEKQAPSHTKRAALELLGMLNGDVASSTVQGLLDALFDIQEAILLELRACRNEQELRAGERRPRRAREPFAGQGRRSLAQRTASEVEGPGPPQFFARPAPAGTAVVPGSLGA